MINKEMVEKSQNSDVLDLTSNIVSAYLGNHNVERNDIPTLIKDVYQELLSVEKHAPRANLKPAVPIEESVTEDHIICLEDGKKLKMIKRHLRAMYGMSVEEYRQRWDLPADYPSVAPNYAKKRSDLAKVIGLGVNGRQRKKAS